MSSIVLCMVCCIGASFYILPKIITTTTMDDTTADMLAITVGLALSMVVLWTISKINTLIPILVTRVPHSTSPPVSDTDNSSPDFGIKRRFRIIPFIRVEK